MENKDKAAFPVMDTDNIGGQFALRLMEPGVSKLEFFACNAPVDIPSWFVNTKPETIVYQEPSYDEIENKEDKETCREWRMDPCYDLPDHLKWFQDRTEKAFNAYSENVRKESEARYFQWRRFYAEQLLTELSKPQP